MGLFDKVFGRNKDVEHGVVPEAPKPSEPDTLTQPEAPAGVAEIAADPEPFGYTMPAMSLESSELPDLQIESQPEPGQTAPPDSIRAFDQNGREILIPREQWRTEVLPQMLQELWSSPEQLYGLIISSLNDGFLNEVAGAAEHLYRTDTIPVRGTCLWAIVLLNQRRVAEAESVLTGFLAEHGEDASVLTNLAKVQADKGDTDLRDSTLWRALELDPNIDNALGWYASLAAERGGDPAAEEALERIRLIPGAWRPQLWLARGALASTNDLPRAMELYREALGRAPKPVPGEFLMQMSGDLGGRGHLGELLDLTGPEFVPEVHGLAVGNNLIKALIDTGDLDSARSIQQTLAAQNRPDWAQALGYWDGELGRLSGTAPAQVDVQVGMLRVDGPIWLPDHSAARAEFGQKPAGGPHVTFLGGTAETPEDTSIYTPQHVEALGRLTRSLPLFLAEQVSMRTAAEGRTMLPWAVGNNSTQPSGFVVSGQVWPDEMARQTVSDPAHRPDYVVTVHIDAESEPWSAELAFIRASDGTRIGVMHQRFTPVDPEAGLRRLADEVVELLSAAVAEVAQPRYIIPAGLAFPDYLLRLEQLLAVRCASMDGVAPTFLGGEREILEGNLNMVQRTPDSLPARLVARETLAAMGKVRPEIAAEFMPRIEQLTFA